MRAFIELSGEHPTLPRAEALAAVAAERVDLRSVAFAPGLLRIDADGPIERVARRLGLAHFVCEELVEGDLDAVRSFARDQELGGRSFRVRSRGLGVDIDSSQLEASVGADFGRTGRVDLENPSVDFRLLVGERFVLGRVVHRVDRARLESSRVARRPFSLPISLHPKFARALVNLSRVPMAGTVLDPFCGTGGILLEASRMGLRGIGTDREARMIHGARVSLTAAKAFADFAVADAGRLPFRRDSVHGIATDPPYGRAASTRGEDIEQLYARAFAAISDLLPPGGHAAVVLPKETLIPLGTKSLELVEGHALRVHRSLARYFCVFVKP